MKTCRRGHTYRGDENYRARHGSCPVCHKEAQARYDKSGKGADRRRKYAATEKRREAATRYNQSEKGADRKHRFRQSPKGWLEGLRSRRRLALGRRAVRENN